MSYDVYFTIDAGRGPVNVGESLNHTSNTSGMWCKAGVDLAEFDGKPASEAIEPLRAAIKAMEDDPKTYRAMNPPNGWGSYTTTLRFLRDILAECLEIPNATMRVWY